MKKQIKITISILLSVIIVVSMFAVMPIGAGAIVPAWKTAYVNYINSVKSSPNVSSAGWFRLYDFDNNGIPEMIFNSGSYTGGAYLILFKNGNLEKIHLTTGKIMIYGNKLYDSGGQMGVLADTVRRFSNGVTTVFHGIMTAKRINYQRINDDEFVFRYICEGVNTYKTVNLAQYNSKLGSSFNQSKATRLTKSNCCNASQIISAINNYNSTPAAPTISVANGVNGLDVAWGKTANTQSYVVYYKTAASSWSSFSTSSTRSTIKNVQSGKFYYVQVQSIGANGVKGNYSKVKTMTHLSRAGITSLTYNGNNTLKIKAVPSANKYQIARLKSGNKSYTYFYTTSTTFTEKNVGGGIAYTYQVRAMYQTAKNGTAYSAWSATKSVPTLVAPTVTLSNKSNGIRVTWNSIRGAVRYIVYYKKSIDKNWSSAVTTNLYYPILNAQRGATYYVQVRPVGSTVSTPYSSVKSIVH